MLIGIFVDTGDIEDIRRGIGQLREWATALEGGDARRAALREVLARDAARVVRLAYRHFGTGRFSHLRLARRSGEDLSVLEGLLGSLALACNRRGLAVFARYGGDPPLRSVNQEVAGMLEAEARAAADK